MLLKDKLLLGALAAVVLGFGLQERVERIHASSETTESLAAAKDGWLDFSPIEPT